MAYESFGLAPGLEELVAVARHEHVTRAAQQLGIPQPTLSRALARLSAQLGTPLVHREGRGVRLTRHGQLLAGHAGRALDELLAGVRAVRAEADPDSGSVVLGFLHSMGPVVVPALLRGFRQTHPGVAVRLVQDAAHVIVEGVLSGRLDLGVAGPVPPHPHLGTRRLVEQPLTLLVPADHRLAGRARVRLAEVVGEPLVTMTAGYGVRTITDQLLRAARLPIRYAYESQEMNTAAGLVAAGLGVAVLPAGAAMDGTVELAIADKGASRTLSIAWSGDWPLSTPVSDLRRYIIDEAPRLLRRDRRP
ncbi:MAG TPA: LysR family transcriptional regulator [Rugosimonospora sp.]